MEHSGTYIRRDIEGAIKRVYGLEEEEEEEQLKPVKCPRCGKLNVPKAKFCHKCDFLLDEKERLKIQLEESEVVPQLMEKILEDYQLREGLRQPFSLPSFLKTIRKPWRNWHSLWRRLWINNPLKSFVVLW